MASSLMETVGVKEFFDSLNNIPMLTDAQVRFHIKNYQTTGNMDSKKIVIESHLKYVWKLVMSTYKPDDNNRFDFFNEGFIGMVQAIDKYDLTKNVKFCTYASHYVKKYVSDYIRNNSNLPKSDATNRACILQERAENDFIKKYGRKPTIDELAYATGKDTEKASKINEIRKKGEQISFDATSNEVAVMASSEKDVEEQIADQLLFDAFGNAIKATKLTDKERLFITAAFDIETQGIHTHGEVANMYDYSRQYVSLMIKSAYQKISKTKEGKYFFELLGKKENIESLL